MRSRTGNRKGTLLRTGLLLAMLAGSGAAGAQEGMPAPPPAAPATPAVSKAELARAWEDVLLLDALRHLRLSRGQLQGVSPLTTRAERRISELLEGSRRTRASLDRLLTRGRRSLLTGQRLPTTDQEQLLFLRGALRERETQTADAVVRYLTPDFARLLLGEQAGRAFKLALGNWPEGVERSPALLDPESGFILSQDDRARWQTAAISQALSRKYPPALVAQSPLADRRTLGALILAGNMVDFTQPVTLSFRSDGLTLETLQTDVLKVAPAQQASVRRELDALRSRLGEVLDEWAEQAPEAQLAEFLRPLARRLFFSPQLATVLEDRLAKGGAKEVSGDAEDAGNRWEEVLLLDAFRYYRLSEEQVTQLRTLSEWVEERMAAYHTRAAPAREHLLRTARRYREGLLHGQPVPGAEQKLTMALERNLRAEEEKAQEALVPELAQRLANLLARRQVTRAARLAFGEWPRDEAKGILLLDRESGFRLEDSRIEEWRNRVQRELLLKKYPAAAVDSVLSPAATFIYRVAADHNISLSTSVDKTLVFSLTDAPAATSRRSSPFPKALLDAFEKDQNLLFQRFSGLGELLEGGATREEMEVALRPIVRRLFLSPRFRPIVGERLQHPEPSREEPAPTPPAN